MTPPPPSRLVLRELRFSISLTPATSGALLHPFQAQVSSFQRLQLLQSFAHTSWVPSSVLLCNSLQLSCFSASYLDVHAQVLVSANSLMLMCALVGALGQTSCSAADTRAALRLPPSVTVSGLSVYLSVFFHVGLHVASVVALCHCCLMSHRAVEWLSSFLLLVFKS